MSEFPSVEADELVTKQFLRAELAELRGEMGELRAELRGEIGALRVEMHRQSIVIVGTIIAAVAALEALTSLL